MRELILYNLPLSAMFSNGNTGNEIMDRCLSGFVCEKDRDLEDFLRNKAVLYEKHNKGKTFLIMNEDKMKNETRAEIYAYFTLAMHSLTIPETASKNLVKN